MSEELVLVDYEQGSEEWHALRRSKRPASVTPMIMGTSKFQDAADAYDAMMGDSEGPAGFAARIIDFGNREEPKARAALSFFLEAQGFPVVGYRGEYSASLDFYVNHRGERCGFEIKCPFSGVKSSTWKAALKGEIEPGYADQIEHQMQVFGLDRAFLYVYIEEKQKDGTVKVLDKIVPYVPRPERWAKIQKEWDRFVRDHLDAAVRPNPYAHRDDAGWAAAAKCFADAKAEAEEAEERLAQARDALVKLADGRKSEGAGVRVNIFPSRGSIDYKDALESTGIEIDLEPFRKAGKVSTTVSIVKEKS